MLLGVTHRQLLALDVVLQAFLRPLELGQLDLQLLDHLVFTLQQRVDKVLLVVLLLFLFQDIFDLLIDKLYLVTEFLSLRIFTFKVATELGHYNHIV